MTEEGEEEIDTYAYLAIPNGIYVDEDLDNLPNELNIFTLPITGSFSCNIDIINIYKYFPLTPDNIVTIKSGYGIRTIQKDKKILKSNEDDNFMNQITLIMIIKTNHLLTENKFVNVKLFANDSFQISGLKSIFQCNYSINKIINLLRGRFSIYTSKFNTAYMWQENKKIIKKSITFFNEDDVWIIEPLISVINVTYKYKSKINQIQFYYKMLELKLHGKINGNVAIPYQPDITSPVTVWLPYINKNGTSVTITIFIFESGSISIMACRCREHVIYAYEFIHPILIEYDEFIVKKDLMSIIENDEEIKQYINLEALKNVSKLY